MIEKSILPAGWEVPDRFRQRLGKTVGRQRPMVAEGHLLLVLHAPPSTEDAQRVGRFFWRAADGTWKSNALGNGIAALGKHLDEYETLIAALDRQEEAATTAEDYFAVLERLGPLSRSARNQHHVLQEARQTCPEHADLIDVRDRAYAIERSAELLYGETKNSLDFLIAHRAEEQARDSRRMAEAAYRLNILAAVFLPIVAVTAILGIDLGTMATLLGYDVRSFVAEGRAVVICLGLILAALAAGAILTVVIVRPPRVRQTKRHDRKAVRPRR